MGDDRKKKNDIGVFPNFDSKINFLTKICSELGRHGSNLAQNSDWHTNSTRSIDLDRSRSQFASFFIDFDL